MLNVNLLIFKFLEVFENFALSLLISTKKDFKAFRMLMEDINTNHTPITSLKSIARELVDLNEHSRVPIRDEIPDFGHFK